jgi:hypothetical protein
LLISLFEKPEAASNSRLETGRFDNGEKVFANIFGRRQTAEWSPLSSRKTSLLSIVQGSILQARLEVRQGRLVGAFDFAQEHGQGRHQSGLRLVGRANVAGQGLNHALEIRPSHPADDSIEIVHGFLLEFAGFV